ncbi:MAG: hypothetical protein L6Q51_11250 [Cyclobacteriaceae bacterium]|nr:hypothetical protein [Cyclobacteriaceae bacterium]
MGNALAQTPTFTRISPFEIGRFDMDGNKVGIWNYYDYPDSLSVTINYDNGSLIYLHNRSTVNRILVDSSRVNKKVERGVRFLGSQQEIINYYQNSNLLSELFPSASSMNEKKLTDQVIWLSFEVNESGIAENPTINPPQKESVTKKLVDCFNRAPNQWLPAVAERKKVRALLTIPFRLCIDACPELEALKPGTVTDQGLILCTPDYRVLTNNYRFEREKPASPKRVMVPAATNLLGWSPDGNWILYKQLLNQSANTLNAESPSVIFRIAKNGDSYTAYNFKENILVTCSNADCSDFILNFPSLPNPVIAFYQSKMAMLKYAPAEAAYFPCPLVDKSAVAFHKMNALSGELYLWNVANNHTVKPSSFNTNNLIPLSWQDENTLLCAEEFSHTNILRLVVVNFQLGTKTLLPFIASEFCDWSPDRSKLLIKKYSPIDFSFKLYVYDMTSTEVIEAAEKHSVLSSAFFAQSDEEIFYLINNDLKLLNISTGKSKQVLSNVSMPSLNPERTHILYKDINTNFIMLFDLASQTNQVVFTFLSGK